jgi:N-alpha-acetyltransferase 35, NatC auxiliary subunit
MTFQAKKPQPLIYIRTLLQNFLFKDMVILGTKSLRQLLDDDLAITVLPSSPQLDKANDDVEAVHDPRFTVAQQMEFFRQRAAQAFLDILRTFCQNRCRVRRTLCHIIQDWDTMQVDAEEVDQIIQVQLKEHPLVYQGIDGPIESMHLPLSSWAYLHKVRQMEWIVQLGFELEVYQKDELAGMYWYLNFLAKSRVQHIERIKTFILRNMNQQRALPGHTAEKEVQFGKSLTFIRLSLLDAAVTWELADALSCIYAVLDRLSLITPPPRPYSSDALRYELRMRPFATIGLPIMPSFEEFTNGTYQAETPILDLLAYAEKAIAGAKKGYDALSKLPEAEAFSVGSHVRYVTGMKNGLKSCIAAGIAVATMRKAVEQLGKDGALKVKAEVPTPAKAYHEWWIVPKIIPVP